MKLRSLFLAAVWSALLVGTPVRADEILVAAAASLTNAFKDIAARYEAGHPGDSVVLTFGASDVLQRQIMHGAPLDIFASADQTAMDKAVQADTIQEGSRRDFARNELVLVVPAKGASHVSARADLASDAVERIAFGHPDTVPAGRYTKAALQASGDWKVVDTKRVVGQNVRQVLDYVARGEVDAGFVFATDAALMPDRVRVVEQVDSPVAIQYPIALVKREGRPAAAARLLDYITSEEGRAVLAGYGFAPVQ